ncbi:MAG TPA: LapA family protein [Azonexus sp.]
MTVLTWVIRLVIFFFLVVFAVQNTAPVTLNFVLDHVWQAPLVIVLLAFFSAGAVLGVLSVLGVLYRQRREIARLRQLADKTSAPSMPELPPAL